MWYPATVSTAPVQEPVSLLQAQQQCGVQPEETYHTDTLTRLIKAARVYAENYCGICFAVQTLDVKCDSFCDFEVFPESPVAADEVTIEYVDTDGVAQTLADTVYEVRADGLDVAIVLKYGQSWPSIQQGSRIVVTVQAGFADDAFPEDARHAMLLHIADNFNQREPVKAGDMTSIDAMLFNYRRMRP